jgi:hypothetical protein
MNHEHHERIHLSTNKLATWPSGAQHERIEW